LGYNLLL